MQPSENAQPGSVQPGAVISPGGATNPVPPPPSPVTPPPAPIVKPAPVTPPPQPVMPVEQPQQYAQNPEPAPYDPGPSFDEQNTQNTANDPGDIRWMAPEFIAHAKTGQWYAVFFGVALLVAIAVYFVTKDIISILVVVLGVAALAYYAGRKPQEVECAVTSSGIGIGKKFLPYDEVRSFALVPEGAHQTIVLLPLKRFAPLTTMYYAAENENQIIDALTPYLPFEEYRHDAVDRLMQRIRF